MKTLFFDNNIPIGYCFFLDPQHKKVKIAFESKYDVYWSKNVKHEFEKVFNRKLTYFEDFIYGINEELDKKNEKLNIANLIDIANSLPDENFNRRSISKIMKDLWHSANFNDFEIPNKVKIYLNDYKRSFKKKVKRLKKDCHNFLILHEREILYPTEKEYLKECVDGEDNLNILGNDMNICLDAHDLAKKKSNVSKLIFITDDNPLYACKSLIETHTKIRIVEKLHGYDFEAMLLS